MSKLRGHYRIARSTRLVLPSHSMLTSSHPWAFRRHKPSPATHLPTGLWGGYGGGLAVAPHRNRVTEVVNCSAIGRSDAGRFLCVDPASCGFYEHVCLALARSGAYGLMTSATY